MIDMTISYETIRTTYHTDAGLVFCDHGCNRFIKILGEIHHGYEDTEPLSEQEIQSLMLFAQQHEETTKQSHNIRVVIFGHCDSQEEEYISNLHYDNE